MPQRRRLLFVDDDAPILRALERMMRSYRTEWECHFADDPITALEDVSRLAPDAVVTDMLMPGIDGAELLAEVVQRQPLSARFILSGEVGEGSLVRMARGAHQCLAKPCRGDVLRGVLQEALLDPDEFTTPVVMEGLLRLSRLPVAATHFEALRRTMAQPSSDARDDHAIALIESSGGIAAKVLQIATWARLGLGSPPTDAYDAYFQLGPDAVCAQLESDLLLPVPPQESTPLQREAWLRAERAARIAGAIGQAEGLLPDDTRRATLVALWTASGPLLLDAACRGNGLQPAGPAGSPRETSAAEREAFGLSAGAMLSRMLRLWGLSPILAGPVERSDAVPGLPADAALSHRIAFAAPFLADSLDGDPLPADVLAWIAPLDLGERLETWRRIGGRVLESAAAA
ncbi:MAG: response regulator [Vicinamibacterales bacterium]